MPSSGRIAVVSWLAHEPFSPRGARTRALLPALADSWEVELVAPTPSSLPRQVARGSWARRVVGRALAAFLVDRHELDSRRLLRGWVPSVDAALLIGYPFSTIALAARRLRAMGTPYVVDVGDPWALTARHPAIWGIGLRRARLLERRMWDTAAGAIVTTRHQEDALRSLCPGLPILVRPNGADEIRPPASPQPSIAPDGVLRLAHFGALYGARVDAIGCLDALGASQLWRSVELHQFGPVWDDRLLRNSKSFSIMLREPVSWEEASSLAASFGAVVAIGNKDPALLPYKAVAYLALPLPRIAIVGRAHGDALAEYVADKRAWLVVDADGDVDAAALRAHVDRRWTTRELALPPGEAWPAVAAQVSGFVGYVLKVDRRRVVKRRTTPVRYAPHGGT